MGQLVCKPIDSMLLDMLKSLQQPGDETKYTSKYRRMEFSLNKFPGCDHAPKIVMLIKDTSIIISQDLKIDGQPIRAKCSKVTIDIGEIVVALKELGYFARVTGKITFYEVFIKLTLIPKFENGISILNMAEETTVSRIKSQILLNINGVDHSRLANVLLNIENPRVGSNVVDAIFLLLKETTLDGLNEAFAEVSKDLGFVR